MDAIRKTTETYDRLTQAADNIVDLQARISDQEAQLKKERLKNDTLYKFLRQFLDEFEGAFSLNKECPSIEIAYEYIDAANFCAHHFDRRENSIIRVQEWIDGQLMPEPKDPNLYDYL